VLGDHLVASANPLATTMAFRRHGKPLLLEREGLAQQLPDAGPRLLVLLHGLCMNDLQWTREGHDHGAALARECGYTPIYLHYNSGLHIAANGQALAQQLEALLDAWPVAIERCVLLGHSMGGLLARSALHHGAQAGQRWPAKVTDLVCLGSPHHGAPLERAGHWVDILLGATPYGAPFARLGKLRSAGITDLRHGHLLDTEQPVPLPEAVRCHAAAASLGDKTGDLKDRLAGDGLVPLDSALGRHPDPARRLAFAEQRQWIGYRMNHLELLNRAEVFAQLRQWLQ
jgi:pimeloyl-ACP methyl ester carboxylesterase